jgi:hypothetical protein
MLISSPGQELMSNYKCPRVGVKISGKDFLVDLIVVKSARIDVILGGDWLRRHMGELYPDKRMVSLRTPLGDRIEYKVVPLQAQENEEKPASHANYEKQAIRQ